ncbi:MAG: PAS domain S-box protein [Myxococcales bacterium]|nr:PAS domain S-box protein [Myxococcales bacterium]
MTQDPSSTRAGSDGVPDPRDVAELLCDALKIVARHDTILTPSAFEELGAVIKARVPFFHLAITKAETPGYFRVVAMTRGEVEAVLPFRTRLQSSAAIHEKLYVRGEAYVSSALDKGNDLERSSVPFGFGSYAAFPVKSPESGQVIAALLVAFREQLDPDHPALVYLSTIVPHLGASVSRGLDDRREARASRILEASGDAMVAWDSEGRLVDLNRAAERLIGAERAQLLGTSMQELFGALPIGPSVGQRLTLYARDGRKVTVAATVSPMQGDPLVFAHALFRDLSEVVAAEQRASDRLTQLRELSEQHRLLLDNAPLLIFRLDPETNELLYLNKHAEHLFDVSAALALETPGFLLHAHVDPEGVLAFEEAVIVAKLGQVMPPYEARLRRKRGEPIVARGTVYPILGQGSRVVGIEGILLDVTSEQAARSRLVQADRLATVGMLSAGVAHEINNPAAFMLLGLDVLSRTLAGPNVTMTEDVEAQVKQLVSDLRETGRRIVDIARDMRLFASPPVARAGRRTLVDVARTVESALTITRAQIVEKAELDVSIAPDLPLVAMDDGRLGQVMVNLLVNAAQAIGEARAARGPMPGDRVRIAATATDAQVTVTVEDTGIGMRPDVIDRVFTPFFTTKHPELGTGLGLAISKQILDAAGGKIIAESPGSLGDPPRGSRFVITLPAHVPAGEAVTPRTRAEHIGRARVLVVEDEVLLGKALADQLSERHDVTLVTGADQALTLLGSERFDVVLCDLKMPTMGGEELYRRVAATDPEMGKRFIFMTGVSFGPELERFLGDVGAPLLEKPFPIRRALGVIDEVTARARAEATRSA